MATRTIWNFARIADASVIAKPTVLVLGAGASMDFGFPSGWQLTADVVNKLSINSAERSCLLQLDYTSQQIDAFIVSLRSSGHQSVDAFLGDRRDFVDVGKAAIAVCLAQYEDPIRVTARDGEPSWLYLLVNRLREHGRNWSNLLSIVTFNYGRVVEFFLYSAMRESSNCGGAEAAKRLMRDTQVVHVHGDLGPLPDFGQSSARPFKTEYIAEEIRLARSRLKILHEGDSNSAEFDLARRLIENASEVVFFGFGFHRVNVERLNLPRLLSGKHVVSSAHGLTQLEMNRANELAGGSVHFAGSGFKLHDILRQFPILGG